jgi:uncharacterized membrane protein (UPF0127 family)
MLRSTLLAWLAACAAAAAAAQDAAQPRLPTVTLNAAIHNIRAEVARSPAEVQIGLMHRREMAPNDGMLFVYDEPGTRCFWMKNTLLPLSIAFIADDGRIVNIADMQPLALDSHCSKQPVRYALEMNQGWFAKRGVKPGSVLQGAPFKAR